MLPLFWILASSLLASGGRGYEYSNTTGAFESMFNWNITNMNAAISVSRSLRSPTFSVKEVHYVGNVGDPYGSNIIEISAEAANQYKYVARFEGPKNGQSWTVVIWNKFAADGRLGGWLGNACRTFTLANGEVRYIAFDDKSQGGWASAPDSFIPLDQNGGYAATWGEFDFGSPINFGTSTFVVSTIAAERAGFEARGMRICDIHSDICSWIDASSGAVYNAYTTTVANNARMGGIVLPGPVRLAVTIGYGGLQSAGNNGQT